MKRIHNGRDVPPEPHKPWSEDRIEAARKRGRRLGQTVNQRDERGWMIPRADTMRRKIYDLMVQGKRGKQIWQKLGISHASYVTQRQNIVSSERLNAMRYNNSHDDKVQLPPGFGKIRGEEHPDTKIARINYDLGWRDAIETAAQIAEHLNGWGKRPAADLADHIAKMIRERRAVSNGERQ